MNYDVFFKITYGLYVISTKNRENKFNGHISNTLFQTTSQPPTLAICCNKNNLSCEYILESKIFSASILKEDTDMKFIGKFGFKSGREIDKFIDTNYKIGITGVPIVIDHTIGYLECKVITSIDLGTHILFIAEIVNSEFLEDSQPLTYANYRLIKKGLSPKNAPTYIDKFLLKKESEQKKEEKIMQKYVCSVCGYVYDPAIGDPDSGIQPGTAFEDIPDDWVCPVCGVSKDSFEKA